MNLFNKYLLLVTFETTDDYSIRNEKTPFAQHYIPLDTQPIGTVERYD